MMGFVSFRLLFALSSFALVSCRSVEAPRSVVLVSVDTLRADRLGCYGYRGVPTPNLDRLAAEGTLFENAATAVPLTLPAHASILTGRTPGSHGVADNFQSILSEDEETLAEILRARGYATGGFVGAFVLDARWGIAQGFDTYFDDFDAPAAEAATADANQRPGDQVLAPALKWIEARRGEPFFAFLHFFDPHTPYAPPEPYRSRYGASSLYDAEIAYVDSLVGELLAKLEDLGVSEETAVVLVGDHGESLGDHGESTHGYFIYDATVHVPLVVRGPGVPRGARIVDQVRTIDIAPTIADLLGAPPLALAEGESLRPYFRGEANVPRRLAYVESRYASIHFGWAPLAGVRSETHKLIDAPEPELYDLRADPGEMRNVWREQKDLADRLSSLLEKRPGARPSGTAKIAPADPETERRLRALGYLTSSSGPAGHGEVDAKALPDPKKKLDLFQRIAEARDALDKRDAERAVALLEAALEEDPELRMAYTLLGSILLGQERYGEAERLYRGALERDDQNIDFIYGLALAYKGQGRLEEAAAGFERCLALDPNHEGGDYMVWFQSMRSSYQLAEVRLAQGRAAEAERILRDTLRAKSDNSVRVLLSDALLAQTKADDALGILRDAERQNENDPLVLLSLGNVLVEVGDFEEALRFYRRAEALTPADPRIANGIGNALARKGDLPSALDAYQRSVALDGAYAPAQNNLGITLGRLGRASEAERAFLAAIESDPAYPQAYNNLGTLYLQMGAAEKAVPLFRRALQLKADYRQAQTNLDAALRRTRSE
jgi:arylsulfatase A-like enzyme/tetratricopeptide (TPR) repeat protein